MRRSGSDADRAGIHGDAHGSVPGEAGHGIELAPPQLTRRQPALRTTAIAVGVVVVLTSLAGWFTLTPVPILSGSMLDTLEPGDQMLVSTFVYRLRPIHRGDIIAFRYPRAGRRIFVKRVIGLPRDLVSEVHGRFYVNGRPAVQAATMRNGGEREPDATMTAHHIPSGQLFVLGDNRDDSLDSRFWGPVDLDQVIGKAVIIYWSQGATWGDVRWNRIGRRLP